MLPAVLSSVRFGFINEQWINYPKISSSGKYRVDADLYFLVLFLFSNLCFIWRDEKKLVETFRRGILENGCDQEKDENQVCSASNMPF